MHDDLDEPLRLPAAPPAPPRPGLPVAAAIVPVVGAVVLWQLTGSPTALWFAALGPLMAIASFADGLRSARRAKRRARREAAGALVDLGREVEERHAEERRRAWRRTPDVAGYADDPDEIWRVVPGRADVIVVGRGAARSALRLDGDAQEADARAVRRRARTAGDMPVHVPREAGIAVSGPP
ncbi:cell division protein FtsK, partial [Microbacterium lacticum]|nr:cell division protein FtsK [Microbacterium lacticum]